MSKKVNTSTYPPPLNKSLKQGTAKQKADGFPVPNMMKIITAGNPPADWVRLERYLTINNKKLNETFPMNKKVCEGECTYVHGLILEKANNEIIFTSYIVIDGICQLNHRSIHKPNGNLLRGKINLINRIDAFECYDGTDLQNQVKKIIDSLCPGKRKIKWDVIKVQTDVQSEEESEEISSEEEVDEKPLPQQFRKNSRSNSESESNSGNDSDNNSDCDSDEREFREKNKNGKVSIVNMKALVLCPGEKPQYITINDLNPQQTFKREFDFITLTGARYEGLEVMIYNEQNKSEPINTIASAIASYLVDEWLCRPHILYGKAIFIDEYGDFTEEKLNLLYTLVAAKKSKNIPKKLVETFKKNADEINELLGQPIKDEVTRKFCEAVWSAALDRSTKYGMRVGTFPEWLS